MTTATIPLQSSWDGSDAGSGAGDHEDEIMTTLSSRSLNKEDDDKNGDEDGCYLKIISLLLLLFLRLPNP